MDLIKTIEDNEEIQYESDSSKDGEDEDLRAPKTKKQKMLAKKKGSDDFNETFSFVSNQKEYMKDTWSDLSAFIRKKAKTTLVDKIEQIRQERLQEAEGEEKDIVESDEEDIDQEWDDIKEKKKSKNKNKFDNGESEKSRADVVTIAKDDAEEEFFEYDESATFQSMNLSRPLLKAIETLRWGHPTPIQAATIPTALSGRDICGCAATGTGKTAAYMLPILERLLFRSASDSVTRVLVMVPTRELGVQVFQVCKQLAQFTTIDVALSVGGLDLRLQESMLRRNPDVVIATPGRLVDHIKNTPSFTLETVEVLILDEADRLLDECFLDQMKEIVKSCAPTRQTLLFSATMTEQVNELALVSLRSPVKIFVDSNKSVAWNLRQEFLRVRSSHEEKQEAILVALLTRTFTDHVIVFIRTKQQCHRLHIILGLLGLRAAQLHGNMSQAQRLQSLKMFKEEQIDILLTTDVAARGLDISGVQTVVNFQLPNTLEQYIHRVGRTARAGKSGRSVTFATEQQRKLVKEIVKSSRTPVKSRIIPTKVIDKFAGKIAKVEPDIARVVEEERAEREIAKLENRANKMQNDLKNGPADRAWIDNPKKQKKLQQQKAKVVGKKAKKKNYYQRAVANMDNEEREAFKLSEFTLREEKRSRRPKKLTMIDEDDHDRFKNKTRGTRGGVNSQKKKRKFNKK